MFVASGIWYAIVAVLAFRAGANAEVLMARIAAQQRVIGLGAVVLAVVLALSWWTRARRARGPRD
jgi:membrane protein DedA with SNARE-associated domain